MHQNVIFSDEKLFTVEAAFSHQNDSVLSKSLQDNPPGLGKVERTQWPASVMVWSAVSSEGYFPLIFVLKGVKINKEVYIVKILEGGFMPWANEMYPNPNWTFQQDDATSHMANLTHEWCRNNCPQFISKQNDPKFS